MMKLFWYLLIYMSPIFSFRTFVTCFLCLQCSNISSTMLGTQWVLLVRKLMSFTCRTFSWISFLVISALIDSVCISFSDIRPSELILCCIIFSSSFPYFFSSLFWEFPHFCLLILLLSFPFSCHFLISKSSFIVILWVFLCWKTVSCS